MKKQIIILLLLAFARCAFAQQLPTDANTNKVSYSDIVSVQGQTQKELFARARKWVLSKNSSVNPYTISMDNPDDGTIVAKGSFSLPIERRKYIVQFVINIACKEGKIKYTFTDMVIQFRTQAGSSGGGFSYWGGASYREAETLEYTLETFYPSRLHGKKPVIKWYEEISSDAFENINTQMQSLVNSFKQALTTIENW